MNGVDSAIEENSISPMITMKKQAIRKLRSRKIAKRTNGSRRRQRVREEIVEADDRDDRLGDDLRRAEPAELLAAVEHQLQPPMPAASARKPNQSKRRCSWRLVSSMNTSRPSTVTMPTGRLTRNTQCQE